MPETLLSLQSSNAHIPARSYHLVCWYWRSIQHFEFQEVGRASGWFDGHTMIILNCFLIIQGCTFKILKIEIYQCMMSDTIQTCYFMYNEDTAHLIYLPIYLAKLFEINGQQQICELSRKTGDSEKYWYKIY